MYRLFLFCIVSAALCANITADVKSSLKAPENQQILPFRSFTGKIVGNKVRLRTKPDFDGHIVRQLQKNDLILVVGEEADFWTVEAPKNTKAYVFRSYVIDNTIEASKVNIRLEPNIEAPIIGQLLSGEKVQGEVCLHNNKWMEIAPPKTVHFFVSKEFVSAAGPAELFAKMEKKKAEASFLLNHSYSLAEEECKKPFEEMDPKPAIAEFEKILQNYSEFEEEIVQAKEGLAALEDNYIKKKVAFLEGKRDDSTVVEVAFPKLAGGSMTMPIKQDPNIWQKRNYFHKNKNASAKMKYWQAIEEGLYSSWSSFHSEKKPDEFYLEQKVNAHTLKGAIESYDTVLKNKPGDYILKDNNSAIAFLYSTHIDLDNWVGKKVQLIVSPRPNNHFAFPAYFVLEVQEH